MRKLDNATAIEFEELMGRVHELAQIFSEGLVYIGGIAVYLHAINAADPRYAEFTHDGDFYISLADMGDLRDIEEVTPNRRLGKHQLIKGGFEFDIYTERQSRLIVPYDQTIAHAVRYDDIKVACLEHLLALKIEAFRDRQSSSKGEKDAKDIFRIALVANHLGGVDKPCFRPGLALPYLTDEHRRLLEQIHRGPAAIALAKGNAQVAKKLRENLASLVQTLSGSSRSRPSQSGPDLNNI